MLISAGGPLQFDPEEREREAMQHWRPSLNLRLMLLITALIGLFCVAAGTYIVKKAAGHYPRSAIGDVIEDAISKRS